MIEQAALIAVFVKCPGCAAVNRVVAAGLAENKPVHCSQCRGFIGVWGKVKLLARDSAEAAELLH